MHIRDALSRHSIVQYCRVHTVTSVGVRVRVRVRARIAAGVESFTFMVATRSNKTTSLFSFSLYAHQKYNNNLCTKVSFTLSPPAHYYSSTLPLFYPISARERPAPRSRPRPRPRPCRNSCEAPSLSFHSILLHSTLDTRQTVETRRRESKRQQIKMPVPPACPDHCFHSPLYSFTHSLIINLR